MKTKLNSRVFAISVALIITACCAAVLYTPSSGTTDDAQSGSKTNNIFSLKYPPFLIASAQETEPMMGTAHTVSLEDEAGICAYYNVGSEIDLTKARDAYQSIDVEADEYIIGIVPDGYVAEAFPRVYTRNDGWIMAYIPKEYPASTIVGDSTYHTTLYTAINRVCSTAGAKQPDVGNLTYYDFQQPNANEMLVIHETHYHTYPLNKFNYTIQSEIAIYSGSYGLSSYGYATLSIDGDCIDNTDGNGDLDFVYGQIDSKYLDKDVEHSVILNQTADGCWGHDYIVFIYKT